MTVTNDKLETVLSMTRIHLREGRLLKAAKLLEDLAVEIRDEAAADEAAAEFKFKSTRSPRG